MLPVTILLCACLSLGLLGGVGADVLRLNLDNFMDVIDGPHHKLVKFYAPWCGNCKTAAPFFLAASGAFPTNESNIIFAEVNAEEESIIADELAVRHYPTYLFFPEDDPDAVEEIAMGSTLRELQNDSHVLPVPPVPPLLRGPNCVVLYCPVTLLLSAAFSRDVRRAEPPLRLSPPPASADVPHLVQQLDDEDALTHAVASRSGFLVVNIYGEYCPGNCFKVHGNLPIIAEIFQNEDISFARLHGEDNPSIVHRFNALYYPAMVIFPKLGGEVQMFDSNGDYTHHTYSDDKGDPVALLEHLNDIMGTARDERGGLLMEAGNIPELDVVVRGASSLLDPALQEQLQQAAAQLPPHDDAMYRYPDMTSMYVRTAEAIRRHGEAWVGGEVRRLDEAMQEDDLDLDERDDLNLALNVMKVFQEMLPVSAELGEVQTEELGEL
eukprot:CAMPEP_0114474048 /NCGR_PEP_ID=MMETSP0104-20121206/13342_1 /TAXON_ID=37642 ORGANISM="Paraphysomonas imperforata, Strain PA2" /NCGR_SAMPLE_ID=MMETSP0104 /ASSEMBLY_ACC=CAM_ASM_000202 /LENGTH=437 /DNA_ID=CAMNT_0001648343 /DNA_START=67 /DNA_END=1381 /DNA_ORIENTATION=-